MSPKRKKKVGILFVEYGVRIDECREASDFKDGTDVILCSGAITFLNIHFRKQHRKGFISGNNGVWVSIIKWYIGIICYCQ